MKRCSHEPTSSSPNSLSPSDSTDEATLDSTVAADAGADASAGSDDVAETAASDELAGTETDTEPVADEAAEAGSPSVRVELADGRSWDMEGTCAFNPDASGPAAIVLDIVAFADDGTELSVIDVWPMDGSTDRGTSFIASLTDAEGVLYVLEAATASGTGDSVTFETGLHENPLYAEDDAPTTTGVFSCSF